MFPLRTDDEMVLLSAIYGNQLEVIYYLMDVAFCNIDVLIPLLKNSKIYLSPEVKAFLDEKM